MSLLLHSEIRIGLFLGCCGAIRVPGAVQIGLARLRHKSRSDTVLLANASPDLTGLALDGERVSLVLGAAYNRYLALEPAAAIRSERDWHDYALARAASLFGGATQEWQVTLSKPISAVRVAAAIESERLRALTESIEGRGARVVRIVPYLSAAFERVRAQLRSDARLWLAVAEPGAATLLALDCGRIARIVQLNVSSDPTTELAERLAREELRIGWLLESCPILWQDGSAVIECKERGDAMDLPEAVRKVFAPATSINGSLMSTLLH